MNLSLCSQLVRKNNLLFKSRECAFTLIELSIVLVVISLIVGGVIGGQALIQARKVQQVIVDVNDIETSINTFKLQYDALPGDMRDAWDYWGTDCQTTSAQNAENCNGNNDGNISGSANESYNVWRHLNLAEIYPGNFPGGVSLSNIAGETIPLGPINNIGYVLDVPTWESNDRRYYTHIQISRAGTTSGFGGPILSPKDAHKIDKKVDDAYPGQGKWGAIHGAEINGGGGATVCYDSVFVYNLDFQEPACVFHVTLGASVDRYP